MRHVEIYCCDYKNASGLRVPYVLETTVPGVKQSHKMTIESMVVNRIDDSLFMARIRVRNKLSREGARGVFLQQIAERLRTQSTF